MSEGGTRAEYGVTCDRRDVGLGVALIGVYSDLQRAFEDARRYDEQCIFQHDHRHDVKSRLVRTTGWSEPIWSGEHVGGCNDRCTPTSHYLQPEGADRE